MANTTTPSVPQTRMTAKEHKQPACFRFDALPADVFDAVMRCLLGHELIQLSHANRLLRIGLLNDKRYWDARLIHRHSCGASESNSLTDVQGQYMDSVSFYFPGTHHGDAGTKARGAFVPVPTFFRTEWGFHHAPQRRSHMYNHPFSMDLWFSLLPSGDGMYDGGVIIGCQSTPCEATDRYPDNNQQFVFVDTTRTLYCSMVGHDEVIAETLEPETWYHLALTFDGGEQSVYLNGSLKKQTSGSVYHEWRYLHYTQLGTGYTTGASDARPTPSFRGWYAFRGVIDEFRLWKRVFTAIEIQRLANGLKVMAVPVYILSTDPKLREWWHVSCVPCSRPLEHVCLLRADYSS